MLHYIILYGGKQYSKTIQSCVMLPGEAGVARTCRGLPGGDAEALRPPDFEQLVVYISLVYRMLCYYSLCHIVLRICVVITLSRLVLLSCYVCVYVLFFPDFEKVCYGPRGSRGAPWGSPRARGGLK